MYLPNHVILCISGRRHSLLRQANLDLAERAQCTVDPKVEGRIFHLSGEQGHLLKERQSQFLQAYKEEVEMQLTNNNNSQLCQNGMWEICYNTNILRCFKALIISWQINRAILKSYAK